MTATADRSLTAVVQVMRTAGDIPDPFVVLEFGFGGRRLTTDTVYNAKPPDWARWTPQRWRLRFTSAPSAVRITQRKITSTECRVYHMKGVGTLDAP